MATCASTHIQQPPLAHHCTLPSSCPPVLPAPPRPWDWPAQCQQSPPTPTHHPQQTGTDSHQTCCDHHHCHYHCHAVAAAAGEAVVRLRSPPRCLCWQQQQEGHAERPCACCCLLMTCCAGAPGNAHSPGTAPTADAPAHVHNTGTTGGGRPRDTFNPLASSFDSIVCSVTQAAGLGVDVTNTCNYSLASQPAAPPPPLASSSTPPCLSHPPPG